jgi:hypothetical protein
MVKINEIYDIILFGEPYWTHPQLDNEKENLIKQSPHIKYFHPNDYNELFQLTNKPKIVCSHTGDYANSQNSQMDFFITNNPDIQFYITNLDIPQRSNSQAIPLGILDCQANIIGQMDYGVKKNNLAYSNFNLYTYGPRNSVFSIIENKKFITQTNYPASMGVESFYRYCNDLITYKFSISPRGNGVDTYRMYECLYFGVIPIVQKSHFTSYFTNILPILEVDSYDILTEGFLNEQYDIIQNRQYNMNILNRWFWIDKIYNYLIGIR